MEAFYFAQECLLIVGLNDRGMPHGWCLNFLETCLGRISFADISLALAEGKLGFSLPVLLDHCLIPDPHKGHLNLTYLTFW
jgi:hypothetical protein